MSPMSFQPLLGLNELRSKITAHVDLLHFKSSYHVDDRGVVMLGVEPRILGCAQDAQFVVPIV